MLGCSWAVLWHSAILVLWNSKWFLYKAKNQKNYRWESFLLLVGNLIFYFINVHHRHNVYCLLCFVYIIIINHLKRGTVFLMRAHVFLPYNCTVIVLSGHQFKTKSKMMNVHWLANVERNLFLNSVTNRTKFWLYYNKYKETYRTLLRSSIIYKTLFLLYIF